jgi:hypothetical protein
MDSTSAGELGLGKKYKGKQCAYCTRAIATTDDHVFCREFFLDDDRAGLPKAPACLRCNREKSALEHYLTALLPFGGRHHKASRHLETMVPPRLGKNRKLLRDLRSGLKQAWIQDGSALFQSSLVLPIDGTQLTHLIGLIARGLIWHHWKMYLPAAHFVYPMVLSGAGEQFFQSLLGLTARNRVGVDLGRGTVYYEGVQGMNPPELTVWRISMYGGIGLADSNVDRKIDAPASIATQWGAITGPKSQAQLWRKLRALAGDTAQGEYAGDNG